MIKIAICDDNEDERSYYTKLIQALCKKQNLDVETYGYTSGEALLFEWKEEKNQTDIVLLDIHMPKKSGIAVAEEIRKMKVKTEIIFVTVDPAYMLEAFDFQAFHYIVKEQTDKKRVQQILLRCIKQVEDKNQQYIQLSCAGEVRNIPLQSIQYFEVVNHIIIVHYGDKEEFEFYTTLGKLENSLMDQGFVRIHKSFLINGKKLARVTARNVILENGSELPIGRTKVAEVKALIENCDNNRIRTIQ